MKNMHTGLIQRINSRLEQRGSKYRIDYDGYAVVKTMEGSPLKSLAGGSSAQVERYLSGVIDGLEELA